MKADFFTSGTDVGSAHLSADTSCQEERVVGRGSPQRGLSPPHVRKSLSGIRWIPGIMVALAVFFLFSSEPLSRGTQFSLGISFILLSWIVSKKRTRFSHIVLILLAGFIGGRYFYWRITQTIYGSPLDLAASTFLVLMEIYAAVMTFFGFFVMIQPFRRKAVPIKDEISEYPSVDVYVPVYNETLDVIRPTILGAFRLDYPPSRLRVYILDDGHREEVHSLAKEMRVEYISRADNRGAKAGNLNHALKMTGGELIAVFDCDHVPLEGFLKKTVGFFIGRPKLAIVQTPHHFYSRDPFERNLGLDDKAPNESDLFYHVIQPGMDLWNSSYFCGSAGILRRSCLEAVGGFRTETVTEDAHTSLLLHAKGFESYYLDEELVSGLSPDTMRDLINQRIRWCRGMIQIFRLENPMLKKGLSWQQKLCYMNAIIYWIFSLPRIFFLIAPLLYIYFRIYSVHAGLFDLLIYLIPYLVISQGTSVLLYRSRRSLIWSIIYEIPLSFYLVIPAFVALFFPLRGRFNVTPKGTRNKTEKLDFYVALPAILLFLLNFGGIVLGVTQYVSHPGGHNMLLMNLFWTTLNTLLIGISLGAMIETRQIRNAPRIVTNENASMKIVFSDRTVHLRGSIKDLSMGGVSFEGRPENGVTPSMEAGQEGVLTVGEGSDFFSLPVEIVRSVGTNGIFFISARFRNLTIKQEGLLVNLVFKMAVRHPRRLLPIGMRPDRMMMGFVRKSLVQIQRFLDHL